MKLIITLMGGLGLFLFGMNFMSQGLQKAAGAKLRGILEVMTKNKLIAVLFGALFTAVIQSSGATTVMVVSFVNSGLMALSQSVGIIFGANIGTTITSQLVAFDLTAVAPVILFLGALMVMFGKKPMIKKIGEAVLGFGALFMGIAMMSEAMADLKEYDSVIHALAGLTNPLVAILMGFLITVIVQSSSVTVSILLLMANQDLVGLAVCFYFVLGCNIGSCTPAVLASLSGKKDAKRAALIHVMFNVFGMIIIGLLLVVGMEQFSDVIMKVSGGNIGRCVANADTFFKVFQTVIFLPFTKQFVGLTYKLVPGEDAAEEGFSLKYIGMKKVFTPATVVLETIQEIERMGTMAKENLKRAMEAFFTGKEEMIARVYEQEKEIDFLCKEITDYLVKINQLELPVSDASRIGSLFHVVNDIERIGDHAENIADAAVQMREDNLEFTKKGVKELQEMHDKVMQVLEESLKMFADMDTTYQSDILALENEIDAMERDLQKSHIRRMAKGKCSPEAGVIFTDLITGLERVGDHATNIAFSVLESDPEEEEE